MNFWKANPTSSFLLAFLFLFLSQAEAADERKKWEFGIHPGISLPVGDSNDIHKEAFHMAATIEYKFTPRFALGLEGGYSFDHQIEGRKLFDMNGDGFKEDLRVTSNERLQVFQATPFIKWGRETDWGTWGVRLVRQYFLVGAGYYYSESDNGVFALEGEDSTGTNLTGSTLRFDLRRESSFGFNVGFGLAAQIWTNYRLGFDLRFHQIYANPRNSKYFIPTLRFSRLF